MLKHPLFITIALLAAIVLFALYWYFSAPAGVETMGESDESNAWLMLGASIVSLLTAVIGLIEKILDRRKSGTQ